MRAKHSRAYAMVAGVVAEAFAMRSGSRLSGTSARSGAARRSPRRSIAVRGPAFHAESTTTSPPARSGQRGARLSVEHRMIRACTVREHDGVPVSTAVGEPQVAAGSGQRPI